MYGKIFDSMYDGTLHGNWEAIVTLQQLIVLCTADGIVDMTPQAISSRTSIPLKIIEKGLKVLADPDPYSRTPGEEGRRIVLMDAHRPWGWVLVNHEKYKRMQDLDTIRAQTRARVQRHRDAKRTVTPGNGQQRHTDTDTDTDTEANAKAGKSTPLAPSAPALAAGSPVNGNAVAYIPLNDGSEYAITPAHVAEFEKLYPAVDVLQTLNEIRGWNLANPTRRKTRAGVLRHVNGWLAKEQNSG